MINPCAEITMNGSHVSDLSFADDEHFPWIKIDPEAEKRARRQEEVRLCCKNNFDEIEALLRERFPEEFL